MNLPPWEGMFTPEFLLKYPFLVKRITMKTWILSHSLPKRRDQSLTRNVGVKKSNPLPFFNVSDQGLTRNVEVKSLTPTWKGIIVMLLSKKFFLLKPPATSPSPSRRAATTESASSSLCSVKLLPGSNMRTKSADSGSQVKKFNFHDFATHIDIPRGFPAPFSPWKKY